MISRKQKRIIFAAIVGGLLLLLFALALVLYFQAKQASFQQQLQSEYEAKIKKSETMEQAAKTRILAAARSIPSGTTLQAEDVKAVEVPADQASSGSLKESSAAVGKITKIDLQPNTPLVASMLFEDMPIARDIRMQEFNVIQLPSNLQKGQFVDVRINFPTGEDFIVLSKKKVRELSGTIVWYEMNETEIMRASSAIIDAYLQGAKLYALTYVDPGLQEAAVANYPSNPKVLDLMQRDPNILEEAKTALARGLRTTLDNNLKAMSDTDKMRVTSGSVTVQQQLQNERITTKQNNEFRLSAQQQVQRTAVEQQSSTNQTKPNQNESATQPSAPALPDPAIETPTPAPAQKPGDVKEPPKTDRLKDVFNQPKTGGS
ncbi:MAG TPA: SAF domain-containing protein [Paenibacillus sp.]|uniref:SAF domain-containing protein n=1 Tax=Paenibacillus sp. TaxID=58172 RepID=UPI002B5A6FBC|nr:SAF domain-containing protein [Paenibacillus sp.]HUC91953.1 SAF domain-containing protein [Paenibacillus sp.]